MWRGSDANGGLRLFRSGFLSRCDFDRAFVAVGVEEAVSKPVIGSWKLGCVKRGLNAGTLEEQLKLQGAV